jgi:hypothetical protein
MNNFKNYVKNHKKSKPENSSIVDYLRDRLVVERFYPKDITMYLKGL